MNPSTEPVLFKNSVRTPIAFHLCLNDELSWCVAAAKGACHIERFLLAKGDLTLGNRHSVSIDKLSGLVLVKEQPSDWVSAKDTLEWSRL